MRGKPFSFFILCIGIVISTLSCTSKEDKLRIAVSSNMQFAFKEIAKAFSEKYQIELESVYSSSGKLTAQILEGAPYHILLSADMKYPQKLVNEGFTNQAPKVYAQGKLVLWTMIKDIKPNLSSLSSSEIQHIAIANIQTAPYGRAALEVLQNSGTYEIIKDKLVFGESIGQTNQFILTKAAQIGFSSLSVVLSPKNSNKGNWKELDANSYRPIDQGIAIISKGNTKSKEALLFYNFIFSEEVQEILKNFGYSVDE